MNDLPIYDIWTVTVTVMDGQVTSVTPLQLTCARACYIDWTFVGGTSRQVQVTVRDGGDEFVQQPMPRPFVVRILNRCRRPRSYTYTVSDGGHPFDPSIDNEPKSLD